MKAAGIALWKVEHQKQEISYPINMGWLRPNIWDVMTGQFIEKMLSIPAGRIESRCSNPPRFCSDHREAKIREKTMQWFMIVLKKYADFSGRARRKEYWMFFLMCVVISFAIGFVFSFIGMILGMGAGLGNIVGLLFTLAILIPSISVGVRRMHDIGRSGWWLLVPIVNLIFMFFDSQPGSNEYGANPKEVAA
jgi:uncharacterized membrane protein YhaH (DUF805 family)